ncbi:MAG TPA: ABC transporter substrate-binding protein, partial [Pirellulaceae bacterium]|nr:ABC transporter substrate-binding protein [Pirellulaceae bacterium]
MPHFLRNAFPYFAIGVLATALVWALSFGTLPKADFTFDNGTEIETLDPALATGQPEHRIINGLFEGLLRLGPEGDEWKKAGPKGSVAMVPQPGAAELPQISEDGRTYTFRLRPEARWSNGDPVTADDFAWSWRRTLHPETGSRYAYQLYYLVGAKNYNLAVVNVRDQVEVELPDRKNPLQTFPRGTIVRGTLRSIHKPPEPTIPAGASDEKKADIEADWKRGWVYAVELEDKSTRWFAKDVRLAGRSTLTPTLSQVEREQNIESCLYVLPDFEATVGVKAKSLEKLVLTLENRTPYFSDLLAFYPLFAVNPKCVETFGSPDWTKAESIVTNGPFKLEFRRIRDRIRMVKNEQYWDSANIRLNVIDAMATKSETTSLNMYLNGQLDWSTQMPVSTIPKLKKGYADQFYSG